MIDFYENKSLKNKSKSELIQSLLLFKMIKNKTLFKVMSFLLILFIKIRFPFLKYIIKKTVYKQFCGGENIYQTKNSISKLKSNKINTTLDFVSENKQNIKDFENYLKELKLMIQFAKQKKIDFIVIKISGLANSNFLEKINNNEILNKQETIRLKQIKSQVKEICLYAKNNEIKTLFDAEESWTQNTIDEIVMELMKELNIKGCWIYNTIQMYRWDRLAYLKNIINESKEKKFILGIKLVRGAYLEKERKRAIKRQYKCPIHKTKCETDRDFDTAIKLIINNIKNIYLFCGTHNEKSTKLLANLMLKNKIKNNNKRIFFSQLYGMSDNISYALKENNFNVSKYLPYGPIIESIPYLIRRLNENSSVSEHSKKELQLIYKEIKSRK